jgi:predicted CoA-binding protein
MAFQNPSDETIKALLSKPHTVAVVGCSPNATATASPNC